MNPIRDTMTKRPDQHNIDPSEAGATDYKNLPQTGRGNAGNLDDTKIDKQNLASEKENEEEPIPGDRPAPGKDVNEAQKRQVDGGGEAGDE